MASTSINRTPASAGDMKKWTFSIWLKRAGIGAEQAIFSAYHSSNYYGYIRFNSDDTIEMFDYETTERYKLVTNRKFRDVGAWYHIVVNQDVENGTSGDRLKIWINGIRETSFSTANYPATTVTSRINNATPTQIGAYNSGSYFNGEMSHIQFVNAESLAPTEFGEFDSTSGIWKIKTGAYATPGTNGFFLKMEDRTNLDLDSSSNAYTFTTTGTITPTYDNPSNNFATFNPNMIGTGASVSNGNCSFASGSSINNAVVAPTLAASKGKWYWEAQVSHACAAFGISDTAKLAEEIRNNQANGISSGNQSISWEGNGYMKYSGTQVAYGDAIADATLGGTTLGFFADLDNNKLYLAEDGVIQNSGTGYTITAPASTDSGYYYLGVVGDQCSATANVKGYVNFGNGVFHTTVLTGTTFSDAAGIGTFKYSPNQGGASNFDSAAKDFYAVCTKNIKAYG